MKFSLILCTINRTKEIEKFLNSLIIQTYKNFEVLIVDQNSDYRVTNIIKNFQNLNIKYFRSEIGLSKARNKALENCVGKIVCFPDDDCFYPPNLLENINFFFENNMYDILMGKTIDENTGKIVAGKDIEKKQELTTYFTLGSSTTLFIKNIDINRFDENFGLGAKYNSEEENDLVFRLLKNNYKGFYNPEINFVYHPPSDLDYYDIKRVKNRSIGLGAFIAKHLFSFEGLFYFFKFNIFRPLLGSILFFIKLEHVKSKFYFFKWLGIWKGFFKYFEIEK
jgi:glycosyltransferase involved in cell wall biosynthesis